MKKLTINTGISKRILDICGGLLAFLITSPLWLVAGFIVIFNDPGPIFYRQNRIGKNGAFFDIYKFRTMYKKQPKIGNVTTRNDPRVFPGGNFLRRYKIDELPQILNVLGGTMSLVGPRPTVEDDYKRMNSRQQQRFLVPPGITGLAQISGNTSMPWGKRIEYDLEYIENISVWLDLKILVRTVFLVLTGRAETHPPGDDEWEDK